MAMVCGIVDCQGIAKCICNIQIACAGAYMVTIFQLFKSKCNILTTIVMIRMIVIFIGWIIVILITIITKR